MIDASPSALSDASHPDGILCSVLGSRPPAETRHPVLSELGKYQHYPRPISIYTGKRNLEWREVSGKGFVYAVTVTRRGPPAFKGQEPYLVATIELDEGVRFLTQIVNCNLEDARVGMRVRVRWRTLSDQFSFPVFEPDV